MKPANILFQIRSRYEIAIYVDGKPHHVVRYSFPTAGERRSIRWHYHAGGERRRFASLRALKAELSYFFSWQGEPPVFVYVKAGGQP